MKFRRIDDDTVRCIVSKEDMQQYGIVLEDFFKNKGKIHDFLHTVVERAEEEVGYEPREGMLSMQIMPISANTISITFSENGNDDYDSILKNIKDVMPDVDEDTEIDVEDISDGLLDYEDDDDSDDDEDDSDEVYNEDSFNKKTDVNDKKSSKTEVADFSKIVVIGLNTIEEMAQYCKAINIDKTVKSDLYYLNNKDMYFMIIEKDRLSAKIYKHILILSAEYTSNITDEAAVIAYIREHGECIIEKKAYRTLRKYL